jgi:cell division septation protein DedD
VADMTHDIADDGFHEIQLSGKQLVFLFMMTTAVSVVIFLCGVLVGRGVRNERAGEPADAALTKPASAPVAAAQAAPPPAAGAAQAQPPTPVTEQAAAQPAATAAEPPSPPADDELTYRKRLESEKAPAEKLKAQGTTARTDARPQPVNPETVRPEPSTPAKSTPAASAAKAASETPAAAGARPGRWVVQLVALRDRGAASSIVQRLSGKGYPAFIVNPAGSASSQVFKVQVGRYDDRGEAEQVARRLEKEEKFNPWISR